MLLTGTDTSLMPKYQRGWSIRTYFFIQMENITDLWESDDNRNSMISSYNQYFPCLPKPNFMTSKLTQRNYSLADPKGIVGRCGDGAGCLNNPALAIHMLDFHCFRMTTYRAIMHTVVYWCPIDIDVIFPSGLRAAQHTAISI